MDADEPLRARLHQVSHVAAVPIRRPVDVVAAYVFDPRTMPYWSAVLYEIEPVDDVVPRPGRTLRANLRILGVRLTVEGELVDVDPAARRATVRIVPLDGGGAIEHELWVDEAPGGAVLHFANRVEVPAWLSTSVSDGLLRRFLDRTTTFALELIRDILEGGEEDDVRRLQEAAAAAVPAPVRLEARPPVPPG